MRTLLRACLREAALVPVVALATYALVAMLPPPVPEGARTEQAIATARARYAAELGLGSPLGVLRPWARFFGGERLGVGAQGLASSDVVEKLGVSARMGSLSLVIAVAAACVLALGAAFARRRGLGPVASAATMAVLATPIFVPAMLVAPWVVETGEVRQAVVGALLMALVPAFALGDQLAAAAVRELGRDHVRTAVAKGVRPATAVLRHALPNVLPDLLDALRPSAAALLAGSFAVEQVLGIGGFGRLYVLAVVDREPALVVVCTTLFAAIVAAVGVLTAVLRVAVDPRAREAS